MTSNRTKDAIVVAVLIGVSLICIEGCGGATDPRSASWSYVSAAIIEPSCATVSCHSRAAAVSGLDFSDADRGFTSLTGLWIWIVDPSGTEANGCRTVNGTVVCQREHRSLVVPFNPAQSRLIKMLRADNAPRMPPDRPLAAADIRLVERWILEGATFGAATGPSLGDGSVDGAGDGGSDAPGTDATPGDSSSESVDPDGGTSG